mmetsp:Transcript_13442/g.43075  ORF Transcript_13442/g.43075 Transcript_13442/m.43075 type:complete len:258 (+) Transcript_13442:907-1680(+)
MITSLAPTTRPTYTHTPVCRGGSITAARRIPPSTTRAQRPSSPWRGQCSGTGLYWRWRRRRIRCTPSPRASSCLPLAPCALPRARGRVPWGWSRPSWSQPGIHGSSQHTPPTTTAHSCPLPRSSPPTAHRRSIGLTPRHAPPVPNPTGRRSTSTCLQSSGAVASTPTRTNLLRPCPTTGHAPTRPSPPPSIPCPSIPCPSIPCPNIPCPNTPCRGIPCPSAHASPSPSATHLRTAPLHPTRWASAPPTEDSTPRPRL